MSEIKSFQAIRIEGEYFFHIVDEDDFHVNARIFGPRDILAACNEAIGKYRTFKGEEMKQHKMIRKTKTKVEIQLCTGKRAEYSEHLKYQWRDVTCPKCLKMKK